MLLSEIRVTTDAVMKTTDIWDDLCAGSPRGGKLETVTELKGGVVKNDERRKGLILLLGAISKNHKRAAPPIVGAINQLIQFIESHEIAIADWNRSGSVGNRKSILQYIGEVFGPPLDEITPIGSLALITLDRGGTPPPLIDHLKSKKNLPKIAGNLKLAAQIIEDNFNSPSNDWSAMVRTGESLSAVAEILYAIWDTLPSETLQWCSRCFRRAHKNSKYCDLHTPKNIAVHDTAYRHSKKIWRYLPSDVLIAWEEYKAKRTALDESFELICDPEDLSVSPHSKYFIAPLIKNMVDRTQQLPWCQASSDWECLLVGFHHIQQLLNRKPSEFNNWNDFSTYILGALNDRNEDSRHPFWILNILFCAEDWLKYEQGNLDGRITDTGRVVVDLFQTGVTDPKELAKRVGISKQVIYRILKRNGLRKQKISSKTQRISKLSNDGLP